MHTLKYKKIITKGVALVIFYSLAISRVHAAGLVPCGGSGEPDCDFNQLMVLIDKIIKFMLFDLSIPLAAVLFAYAGYLLMTSGDNSGKRTRAKGLFMSVGIGLVVALAAWLIIETILSTLGYDGSWIGF